MRRLSILSLTASLFGALVLLAGCAGNRTELPGESAQARPAEDVAAELEAFNKAYIEAFVSKDIGRLMRLYHPDYLHQGRDFAAEAAYLKNEVFPWVNRLQLRLNAMEIDGDRAITDTDITTSFGTVNDRTQLLRVKGRWLLYGDRRGPGRSVIAPIDNAKQRLIELSARDGGSLRVLVSEASGARTGFVAVLLPGGRGDFLLEATPEGVGMINAKRLPNRLRQPLLERGVASWLVDSPSDARRMSATFRRSPEHLADLGAVLDAIGDRHPNAPIIVVGHSRGSLSAAQLAAKHAERIAGLVLIAGVFERTPEDEELSHYDWSRLEIPVMLIHHEADGCVASPYRVTAKLVDAHPNLELLSLRGATPDDEGGCSYTSAHNLTDQENTVADAIAHWATQADR